jgi:uncharacterized membrane protein
MEDDEDWRARTVSVASILVLGAGFVAMFFEISWFWMIWVLGYTVFVPLLAITLGVDDEESEETAHDEREEPRTDTGSDALETLRDRYARGELTDEQFERKLERLLETETIEDLEDARRDLDDTTAPDVEFEDRTARSADEEPER